MNDGLSAGSDNFDSDPQGHQGEDLGEEIHHGQEGKGPEPVSFATIMDEGTEDRNDDAATEGEVEGDLFQSTVVEVAVGAKG